MMKIPFVTLAALLTVFNLSAALADRPCTQEDLYKGRLALEPELVLSPQDIHYQILGEDHKETIVLIHGLGGSMHTWWEVAKDLADSNYKVILYDQRGHGDTPRKGENYSSSMMASDLKVLLDHLHIEKAHILGHSMGARTAMRFAHLFPERVSSVISEDMHMMGRRTLLPDEIEYSRKLDELSKMLFDSITEAEEAAYRLLGVEPDSEYFDGLGLYETHDWQHYRFTQLTRPSYPLYRTQGLQEDLTQALASVTVPVLFLAAEREAVLFGKGVDHVRATHPSAKIDFIPDSDHGVHDSNFQGYMHSLKDFLKSTH